jgi:hypothetical protein
MGTLSRHLQYRIVPLGKISPAGAIVTVWSVTYDDTEIGFVISSYKTQILPTGRTARPLMWAYITYSDVGHSPIKFIYESRQQAGLALKECHRILLNLQT